MIMPIDIDKKEFSRDKRGYNSREVDEFLDEIVATLEQLLNDNRSMAHKIKGLEKNLAEATKSDTAMVETLETAKKLMADISASAERRAELIMRDAELEAENMMLEAKANVRRLTDEHQSLKLKVERLRDNYKRMLTLEMAKLENDEYELLPDLEIEERTAVVETKEDKLAKAPTIVVADASQEQAKSIEELLAEADIEPAAETVADPIAEVQQPSPITDINRATISDLSESLKRMAEEPASLNDTIILK